MSAKILQLTIGLALLLGLAFTTMAAGSSPAVRAAADGPRTLPSDIIPAQVLDGSAQRVGPHAAEDQLQVVFMHPFRDAAGLQAFVSGLGTPGSANYQQPLTLAQANARFNPDAAHEKSVVAWLQANGVTRIVNQPNHLFVQAWIPTKLIGGLLNTTISDYKSSSENRVFFAPDRAPTLPAQVSAAVSWIAGLDNAQLMHSAGLSQQAGGTRAQAAGPTSPHGAYNCPASWLYAYSAANLYSGGTKGVGQNIAITLWTRAPTDAVINGWSSDCGGATGPTRASGRLQEIFVDGVQSSDTDDGEAALDIETAGGIASGANIKYYEATQATVADLAGALNAAGTASTIQIISNSWGAPESQGAINTLDPIFQSNSATGHVYIFSAGDDGSWANGVDPFPNYPASSQYVLSVGGTALSGEICDVNGQNCTWPGEVAWDYTPASGSSHPTGSGGGYSKITARPAWQVASGFSNTKRGYPDVAAVGDPATGAYVCDVHNGCYDVGGTSLAAPIWAGMLAIINQYLNAHGKPYFSNPGATFYGLYATAPGLAAFHDITGGTNGAYNTTAHWDAVTGLGSPNVGLLAPALANYSAAVTLTPTRTRTRTATATPTRTKTPVGATATPTRTATRTATPVAGCTAYNLRGDSGNAGHCSSTFSTDGGSTLGGWQFTQNLAAGIGIRATSASGIGIYGISTSSTGVYGYSGSSYGAYARSGSGYGGYAYTVSGVAAFRAHQNTLTSGHYGIISDGDVLVNGNLTCTGSCLAALSVRTDSGDKLVYADSSTQNYISDQGSAKLSGGRVTIKIDPLYARTVNLGRSYMVIVTPNSADTAGLAVVNKTATSFDVVELAKGSGNFSFDYRITALRQGFENLRLGPAPQVPSADLDAAQP